MIRSTTNRKLNLILRLIGEENMINTEAFVEEASRREYHEFQAEQELDVYFEDNLKSLYENNSYEDIDILKSYSGISFKDINAILRNNWSYEYNGLLTDEKRKNSQEVADKIRSIMFKSSLVPTNMKTYRGVGLSNFRDYGVTKLEDLLKLKGEYYFDSGFTSTALLRERSFFSRPLDWHERCNIEIEYLIPEEYSDGVPMITDELSYSPVQTEYLLNSDNLSKIIDVEINRLEEKAYLKVLLIPQKVWDKNYKNQFDLDTPGKK